MTFRFSKLGDTGYTSLLGGQRVPKCHPRPETYGIIDEAASALGLARASTKDQKIKDILLHIQKDFMILNAELATCASDYEKFGYRINNEHVSRLDGMLEELLVKVEVGKEFVYPGETFVSSAIHLGRSIVRRAERKAIKMKEEGYIENDEILRYLNRCADLLFTLAQYEEHIRY
ncbi:MAG: cob(I)yrinic acid a,c-diamide adenosyltransferase [Thermodesulfobacteriota bacterium]|nr:cob(I)yrinic acid a,c-diamide adenosyltransferase [Thermodesulfobacteriota bacterium]